MSGIFISYRREETAAYAGRLRDRLIQEFGADQVFMDVDTIDLGVDFTEVIENAVSDVDVLLCVMGSEWASLTDESGKRRVDDPADFVRVEVASALKRNIRVIPVLVKDAKMPSANQLPPDLSALVKRNALQLGDARFHSDVDLLVQSLRRLVNKRRVDSDKSPRKSAGLDTDKPSAAREQHKPKAMLLGKWLAAALILFVIAGGTWYIWEDYQVDQRRIAEQRAAEAEAKLKAQREAEELEAKQQAEAEAKRKAEAEAKLKAQREAELEAKRQAEAEAERKAAAEAAARTAARGTVAVPDLRMLKGISAVTLEFNWNSFGSLDSDFKRYGLDEAELNKTITERLQKAGLKVLSYDEALRSAHAVLMRITVNLSSGTYRWASYKVGVKVESKLSLAKTQGAFTSTTVWSDGKGGPMRQVEVWKLRNYILGMVDQFVQDYRAQNEV